MATGGGAGELLRSRPREPGAGSRAAGGGVGGGVAGLLGGPVLPVLVCAHATPPALPPRHSAAARRGEAVAYGMLVAAELGVARGMMPDEDRQKLARILMQLGPLPPVGDLSTREALDAVKRDKKVVDGTLHYVLCTSIGAWTTVSD